MVPVIFFGLILSGCSMFGSDQEEPVGDDSGLSVINADTRFELSGQESISLYQAMVGWRRTQGEAVNTNLADTAVGKVECIQEGMRRVCYLRVRAKAGRLSRRQQLPRVVAGQMWEFFGRKRPRLVRASRIAADFICDHVGPESPPYEVDKTDCRLQHPRLPNETVISGRPAQAMADLLRNELPYGNGLAAARGGVLCQRTNPGGRYRCFMRSYKAGVLGEAFAELGIASAKPIGKLLWQTHRDEAILTNQKPEAPSELMASVICAVDSREYLRTGKRHASCRMGL